MTVWTLLHPSVARGMTVGLFTPGSTATMSFRRAVGTFISTYFLSSAALTASMRNSNSSSTLRFASSKSLLAIRRASLCITVSTSMRLLLTSVEPLLTMSKMASASPMPGLISTLPVMTWMSAAMCFSCMKRRRMAG